MQDYHNPVMSDTIIHYLSIIPEGIYVDGTLGGGGHSLAIARNLSASGRLIAFDQDQDALDFCEERFRSIPQATLIKANYADLGENLARLQIAQINGIILDLGVSSHQLDEREKGFSFADSQAPLNMDFGMSGRQARDILRTYTRAELARVFRENGELTPSGRLADAIVQSRLEAPIESAGDLIAIAKPFLFGRKQQQSLAKLFQALRIEVNQELLNLQRLLKSVVPLLAPDGVVAIISYHSLEDRLVKQFFFQESQDCLCPPRIPVCQCGHRAELKVLTKRSIVPSDKEIESNPRARSARLRAAQKIRRS